MKFERCPFCYRGAVVYVVRQNGFIRAILGKPNRTIRVCTNHVPEGVRRAR